MEKGLLLRLRQGSHEAYRRVFDEYYVLLCQFAFAFLKDAQASEDVVMSVMTKLWENRERLASDSNLSAYLYVSVKNRCFDYLSLSHVKKEQGLESEDTYNFTDFIDASDPLGAIMEKEGQKEILDAINHLPDKTKKVFMMSRFEGLKYSEISERCRISIDTVKYHIKNALSFLRVRLEKYFD